MACRYRLCGMCNRARGRNQLLLQFREIVLHSLPSNILRCNESGIL